MINFKSVPIKYWLAIAFFIILCFIIFGRCNNDKPVEKITVVVPDKNVIKERDAYRDTVDMYRKQIEQAKLEKHGTEKLLKRADTELKSLIVRYNKAVIDQNVPVVRETCDSIVLENMNLLEVNNQFQHDMNELIDYYELALKASDSAAIKSNYLLMAANKSNAKLTTDYNDLAKVYNKEARKTKRNRGLNRVLAGAVVVLGGLVLVK